jgi:hypothetical protein
VEKLWIVGRKMLAGDSGDKVKDALRNFDLERHAMELKPPNMPHFVTKASAQHAALSTADTSVHTIHKFLKMPPPSSLVVCTKH